MNNGTEPSLPLEITEQLGVISGQKVGGAVAKLGMAREDQVS